MARGHDRQCRSQRDSSPLMAAWPFFLERIDARTLGVPAPQLRRHRSAQQPSFRRYSRYKEARVQRTYRKIGNQVGCGFLPARQRGALPDRGQRMRRPVHKAPTGDAADAAYALSCLTGTASLSMRSRRSGVSSAIHSLERENSSGRLIASMAISRCPFR